MHIGIHTEAVSFGLTPIVLFLDKLKTWALVTEEFKS